MIDRSKSPAAGAVRQNVVIERTYRARVEELWELWTTKRGFESWWGPEGFRVQVHALEARVGGALHYDMIADTPQMIEAMKLWAARAPTGYAADSSRSKFTSGWQSHT